MTDATADTVVILSSELIARITEEYFNKTMFKQPVEIVDLKPTETGYMFSIAFVSKAKKVEDQSSHEKVDVPGIDFARNGITNSIVGIRDSKGKFVSTKSKE